MFETVIAVVLGAGAILLMMKSGTGSPDPTDKFKLDNTPPRQAKRAGPVRQSKPAAPSVSTASKAPTEEEAEPPDHLKGIRLTLSAPINREAFRVFAAVEKHIARLGTGHRILAEVSLPAFIRIHNSDDPDSNRQSAFNSFARKRVDLLIIDRRGTPVLAIEYHGSGHYRGNARQRDAVKRELFARAGLPLLEILKGTPQTEFLEDVTRILHTDPRKNPSHDRPARVS